MFGSAEFLGQPKATPVADVMPVKDISPLPKTDMSMGQRMNYDRDDMMKCNSASFFCKWFWYDLDEDGLLYLWWFLIAIAFLAVLLWGIWKWLCGCMWGEDKTYKEKDVYTAHKNQKMNIAKPVVATAKMNAKKVVPKKSAIVVAAAKKKDDLKIIEGIGPKVEKLLHSAGVMTFADLAKMTPAGIKKILTPHGSPYSAMTTDTWPRQSGLARDGKMKELEALKEKLDGGKIV
jgi:predicted flap endonuclease-1-like 5' DNA nuclease